MNPNSKKIRIYIFITLLLSAAAVTLRTIACSRDLGYVYGYFNDKLLINIAGYIAIGSALIVLTYPIFAQRMNAEPSFSTPITYVPTGIVSVGIPYLAITIKRSLDHNASELTANLTTVLVILSFLSVIHFFLNAFNTDADAETRGYFSLATVLFLALYAAYLYFDTSLPINSPNKVADQLAFLTSALFFLYESRNSLSRERWTGYVTFGLMAAFFTAYSSIPSVIVYISKGAKISNSIEESIFTLAIFLFITSRLILASLVKERRECGFITAMADFAEARNAVIQESMKVHKEAFAVQMTIDDLIDGAGAELVYEESEPEEEKDDEDSSDEFIEEQIDFFCEGGLEISQSDAIALEAEASIERKNTDEKEEVRNNEEDSRN